jgi:hypothetical protein
MMTVKWEIFRKGSDTRDYGINERILYVMGLGTGGRLIARLQTPETQV